MFSCEFCEISKNTFSYRTPLVAASGFYYKDVVCKNIKAQTCEYFKNILRTCGGSDIMDQIGIGYRRVKEKRK